MRTVDPGYGVQTLDEQIAILLIPLDHGAGSLLRLIAAVGNLHRVLYGSGRIAGVSKECADGLGEFLGARNESKAPPGYSEPLGGPVDKHRVLVWLGY